MLLHADHDDVVSATTQADAATSPAVLASLARGLAGVVTRTQDDDVLVVTVQALLYVRDTLRALRARRRAVRLAKPPDGPLLFAPSDSP